MSTQVGKLYSCKILNAPTNTAIGGQKMYEARFDCMSVPVAVRPAAAPIANVATSPASRQVIYRNDAKGLNIVESRKCFGNFYNGGLL